MSKQLIEREDPHIFNIYEEHTIDPGQLKGSFHEIYNLSDYNLFIIYLTTISMRFNAIPSFQIFFSEGSGVYQI